MTTAGLAVAGDGGAGGDGNGSPGGAGGTSTSPAGNGVGGAGGGGGASGGMAGGTAAYPAGNGGSGGANPLSVATFTNPGVILGTNSGVGGGNGGAGNGGNVGGGGGGGAGGYGIIATEPDGISTSVNSITAGAGGNGGYGGGNLVSGDGGGGGGGGIGVQFTSSAAGASLTKTGGDVTGGGGGAGGGGGNGAFGGNGGNGGDGGNGIQFDANGSFTSFGNTVRGGDGGDGGFGGGGGIFGGKGGNGGKGGVGLSMSSGGKIDNDGGTIRGGNGGTGGPAPVNNVPGGMVGPAGNPGTGGNGIVGNTLTITNLSGLISGGNAGTGSGVIAGGAGILGSNLTVINSGTITGGLAGDGVTRANAIIFTGGLNYLTGAGTTGSFTLTSGSIFAPGNGTPGTSMTVSGNLAFQSGALYLIKVNPSAASSANVAGIAILGGAYVNAMYFNGSYVSKQYTILTAGAISGTFGSLADTNRPANIADSLSYDATHVYLNTTLSFVVPGGLNGNQQAVANALTNYFNSNGGIPAAFGTLSPAGLTQVSGEAATGSQQSTFNAMNQFMGVMTDPFIAGRGDGAAFGGNATGYADEALGYAKRPASDALAAIYTKAPPLRPVTFEQRWSVWAAGFGGSQTTDGNATLGSNTTTSSLYGTAVGADYRFSPDTLAGFAVAGGGTSFSVANSGSGRSDLFQAGAFIRHNAGPAYISAALAYGWQDVTTNRNVTVAGFDQYQARFNANAYSGRLEGGYRYVTPYFGGLGITPYAAGQFTTFDLPSYAEGVLSGTNTFALAYGARSVTDTRSELGLRTDKSFAVTGGILTLRGRAAWAHDYDPDRSIAATFQTLPGASFVVNGARQASDSALTTASAEMKWINGWSAAATFEGEFSDVTRSYAGKGVVRYTW